MPKFNKGAAAAEAASKAASSGGRADYLSVKSGDRVFVRPVTDLDDLIEIDVHMGVPTKKAPENAKNWPSMMSAICRDAAAFRVYDGDEPTSDWEKDEQGRPYGDCYIHANYKDVQGKFGGSVARPRSQVYGLFVLREPVEEGGKVRGFRDVMHEIKDKDGQSHRVPKIVVASQSWSNFWGAFKAAAYMTGTICSMDFIVARTENDYTVTAGRETADHAPGTESWARYEKAMKLRDLTLEKVIMDQASVEYYGRFFDPSWVDPEAPASSAEDDSGAGAAAAADEISPEAAEAMRAKMGEAFGQTQAT